MEINKKVTKFCRQKWNNSYPRKYIEGINEFFYLGSKIAWDRRKKLSLELLRLNRV